MDKSSPQPSHRVTSEGHLDFRSVNKIPSEHFTVKSAESAGPATSESKAKVVQEKLPEPDKIQEIESAGIETSNTQSDVTTPVTEVTDVLSEVSPITKASGSEIETVSPDNLHGTEERYNELWTANGQKPSVVQPPETIESPEIKPTEPKKE